jgi:FAD:protein FMN transferase
MAFLLSSAAIGSNIRSRETAPPSMIVQARYVMGTILEVQLPKASDSNEELFTLLFASARHYDEIFSIFKPTSPVSQFNNYISKPFSAPAEMIELTAISQKLTEQTEGAFDITIGPLMRCWRSAVEQRRLPRPDQVAEVQKRVGAAKLTIDVQAGTITPSVNGMELDFGGIAKGYYVDKMVELLRVKGIERAFINFGQSSIATLGTAVDDHPWSVSVRDPQRPERVALEIHLSGMAIGSSASYEQSGRIGKRRISHILDPRSGEPANSATAVTVIAPSATLADALSTALVVLPPRDGIKLLERFPGTDAVIFYRSKRGRWQRLLSDGMKNYLKG